VEAFKSTLEEALKADILIHLIDASHPMAVEQAETTFEVLKELGAEKKPILTVLNKIDKPESQNALLRLKFKFPRTTAISAVTKEGFDRFEEALIDELKKLRRRITIRIPQKDYHIVSEIREQGQVVSQEYEENDILITADVPAWLANKLSPPPESPEY
jgi:GTP-binding protein HflX